MGVFEKVGDTISSTSKDVVNKAKFAGDVTKIKKQITYEEEKVIDFYTQLGKSYYNDNSEHPDSRYSNLCNEVEICIARIERLKQQIYSIKGVKVCKNCGAVVNDSFLFCGVCGTKLPETSTDEVPEQQSSISQAGKSTLAFSQGK